MIDERSSLRDICILCTELARNGTTVVLTGGSAATIYVPDRYQSYDADFIIVLGGSAADGATLSELGYSETIRASRIRIEAAMPERARLIGNACAGGLTDVLFGHAGRTFA